MLPVFVLKNGIVIVCCTMIIVSAVVTTSLLGTLFFQAILTVYYKLSLCN